MFIHFCEFSMCIAQLTVSPRFSFLHNGPQKDAEQFFQDVSSMMYFLCIFSSFSTFLSNFQVCYQFPYIFHVCLLFFSILFSIKNPYLFHVFPMFPCLSKFLPYFSTFFLVFPHLFANVFPRFPYVARYEQVLLLCRGTEQHADAPGRELVDGDLAGKTMGNDGGNAVEKIQQLIPSGDLVRGFSH